MKYFSTHLLLLAAMASIVPAYAMLEAMGTDHLVRQAEDDCPAYYGTGKLVSVVRQDKVGVICTYKSPSAELL